MRGGRSEGEVFGVKNFEGSAVTGHSKDAGRTKYLLEWHEEKTLWMRWSRNVSSGSWVGHAWEAGERWRGRQGARLLQRMSNRHALATPLIHDRAEIQTQGQALSTSSQTLLHTAICLHNADVLILT